MPAHGGLAPHVSVLSRVACARVRDDAGSKDALSVVPTRPAVLFVRAQSVEQVLEDERVVNVLRMWTHYQ